MLKTFILMKTEKTTSAKTLKIGEPSERIKKAFQVLCDANVLLGSKWINPSLYVLPGCNLDTNSFWIRVDKANTIYGHIYVDIFSISIYDSYIEIMFTIHKSFDDVYSYQGNRIDTPLINY